ncbi:MAG: hypothetical protein P1V36_03740, partial [Planctomycetota bacterium]|nr:hypothetical protein [Planctomycetota bacterium]
FELESEGMSRSIDLDSEGTTMTIYRSVSGKAECGGEDQGFELRFNGREKKTTNRGWIEFLGSDDEVKLADFAPAEKAFGEACAAWVAGDHEAAEQAAGKALRVEPSVTRVYRSLARALAPSGERRADAKDAAKSVELWRDDFELRRAVLLLRAWAGDAGLGEAMTALAEREAAMNVRHIGGL